MSNYKYLIVGGGMVAAAAVHGIREVDAEGSIGIVSSEADPPYNRPPLSKGLWKGDEFDSVWDDVSDLGVTLTLETTIKTIDPENKRVIDDKGRSYSYDKLLLATGGSPRRLPFGGEEIIYYRSLADYRHLRALTEEKQRFAVIGGGFIGWEIAAALAMNGKDVVMLFPEEYIGHRLYPPDLGHFLNRFYAQKGIEVRAETMVTDLNRRGNDLVLTTRPANGDGGGEVSVDAVVGGIGIVPNVGLAKEAGLAVSDGIEVDEYLRTSHPGIFAAGDVAVFYSPALGKRLRMEHEDNAKAMGRQAGRAMAGAQEPYHYLPFFYSDLFELGYEAVGMVDSRLETVSEWTEPNHEGVIAYLEAGRVRGVLLWNVWERVDAARQVVARGDALNEPALRSLLRAKFLRRVAA